jgi:phosphoribosylformimino-5-aminoimidazole carboxamide ribotide isomerase
MEIIPAIDIIDGKCVRLTQGDYNEKKVYNENPLAIALKFEQAGIKRLHLVDLDGAKSGKIINVNILESIAKNTNLIVDFGGGLKSADDFQIAFDHGAAMVTGGSIAVKNPSLFAKMILKYGADKVILGADVLDRKIAISGWKERSEIELFELLDEYLKIGIKKVISTDISVDGMLIGPSMDLYKEILSEFPEVELIASGGVSSIEDVIKLKEMNLSGVIIGKAIYENKITLDQLKQFLIN